MKSLNSYLQIAAVTILFAGIFDSSWAQEGIVLEANSDLHKSSYINKMKQLELTRDVDFFYYGRKINLNKYEELKAAGVDLKEYDTNRGALNYKEYSLVASTIVLGTITKRVYNPSSEVYFHSDYEIQIEKVLKGGELPENIHVKTVSGAYGESFLTSSDDPELFIGEQVILYLDPVDLDFLGVAKTAKHLGKELNLSNDHTEYIINEKLSLKSGLVYDGLKHHIGSQAEIMQGIEKIVLVNDAPSFNKIKF